MSLTLKTSYISSQRKASLCEDGARFQRQSLTCRHEHHMLTDTASYMFTSVFYLLSSDALPSHQRGRRSHSEVERQRYLPDTDTY